METLLRAGVSNAAAATVLALLVACLARPLARRPAILHGLWLLVLVKLVTPPIYEVAIPWPIPAGPADESRAQLAVIRIESEEMALAGGASSPDHLAPADRPGEETDPASAIGDHPLSRTPLCLVPAPPSPGFTIDWLRWTGTAWLGGTLVLLVVSGRRIRRFHHLLRTARPATVEEREWVEALADQLGLRRVPELRWIRARVSPLVWSLAWRPRLIIPQDLWKTLDKRQRSTLVVHELAHLKRGDHLVRFLELLVTALYWWHPLIWWIRQSLRDAEEQCCDAWVVWAFPEAARSYAETLLDTLDFVHRSVQTEPMLASGLGKVPQLRRRLTMIMTGSSFRMLGVRGTLGLLVLAGIMLPVGATWAQDADETKEVRIVVKSDEGRADLFGDVSVQVDPRIVADGPSPKSAVVMVQVDDQEKPGTMVIEGGSLEDLVKQLQQQIDEMKKSGEPSDAAKDRIKILAQALDELAKAKGGVDRFAFRFEDGPTPKASRAKRAVVKELTAARAEEDTPDITKMRQEAFMLRKAMEAKLKELEAAQEKIRKLGGDPGEVPVIQWRRSSKGQNELRSYFIAKPAPVGVVKPSDVPRIQEERKVDVKRFTIAKPDVVTAKPSPDPKPRVVIRRDEQRTTAVKTPEPSRIEILEKRLKALLDEVERLKKGSADDTQRY